MHRGFKLEKINFPTGSYEVGKDVHADHKAKVHKAIDAFRTEDGRLDADRMQANWFPLVPAEVFICHSHSDAKTAIEFSGWLKNKIGLTAFVDSCVWGFADELLRLIDNAYCYQEQTNTYSYEKRNRSTSHVHMMLSVALSKMIDATECVVFLDTPASIVPSEVIGSGATLSPWIYSELAMTKLIRTRSKEEHRGIVKVAKRIRLGEAIEMLHAVELEHLVVLSVNDLNRWAAERKGSRADVHGLDLLYQLKGVQ
ncbi:hypothetical protein [Sorangium sp. So ce854]|uniref:hypothetical protein n=1 Tax=Sorangium sp. So ce854 TaxID=3133322 RepID=UPI003F5E8BCA